MVGTRVYAIYLIMSFYICMYSISIKLIAFYVYMFIKKIKISQMSFIILIKLDKPKIFQVFIYYHNFYTQEFCRGVNPGVGTNSASSSG